MFRKIALTGASLLAFTLLAWAANAPTYKDSGGVDRRAQGVIIVNPDGSFQDMSGIGGGGGGGGSVTIDQTTQGTTNGVQLKAGSAIAGKLGIDQTTPGTTNKVSIGTDGTVAIGTALPAGTALLGKTGIDQTTPGTTNKVSIGTDGVLAAGSSIIGKVGIDQTTPGTTNGVVPGGNVADSAADSGNPIKIGGKYLASYPAAYTDGNRGDLQIGTRGSLRVQLEANNQNTPIGSVGDNADAVAAVSALNNLRVQSRGTLFNGSTWDRAFTCPSSATVSVTAAATTQIVALGASQVIRVCSFVITSSATGTAKFVYGTGSNCVTSPSDLTAAFTMATATPVAISAGNNSLFRTASANALCLTATGGNITGFISYAQF